MEKPVQYFTDEYLERCRGLTSEQIISFLEDFRHIAYAGRKTTMKLISVKVPQDLLDSFRFKAELEGRPYQSVIKDLMREWLSTSNPKP